MTVRLGIDVGGSMTDIVATDGVDVLARLTVPTTASDARALADDLAETARKVLAEIEIWQPETVGIGMPGLVDVHRGTVSHAVNVGVGSEAFALAHVVADRLQAPTAIDNDVRAAALEVLRLERLREPQLSDLLFINLGTGVSAAIVLDGIPRRGPLGTAGEIGHVPVPGRDEPCLCGRSGCFEAMISGPALARRSPFDDLLGLLDAAKQGHAAAQGLVASLADDLVFIVRWLSASTGIGRVLFGGGVGTAGAGLLDEVRLRLQPSASDGVGSTFPAPSVAALPAGHPTGALGAAALALSGLPLHVATSQTGDEG